MPHSMKFCFLFAFLGLSLFSLNPSHAQRFPDRAVTYTTFQNQRIRVYPWTGNYVALMTLSKRYNAKTMRKIVGTLDRAYRYYWRVTGRHPQRGKHYRGKLSIVEVHKTCGAGCGYLGSTGIELLTSSFRKLYRGVHKHNHYDQVLFYELGRNFWFYGKQATAGAVTTGFAVFMRFRSMEAAGVKGGPFGTMSFRRFKTTVRDLLKVYRKGNYTWRNTVGSGKSPGWGGGTDMFASFMMHLTKQFGGDRFLATFWQTLGKLPRKTSSLDAVNNLATAAVAAGGWPAFQRLRRWRWPVSKASVVRKLRSLQRGVQKRVRTLGGIHLNRYCQWYTKDSHARAILLDARGNPTRNPRGKGMAYRWKCKTRRGKLLGMNLNAACQRQYAIRGAFAKATNPSYAYSWKCFRR